MCITNLKIFSSVRIGGVVAVVKKIRNIENMKARVFSFGAAAVHSGGAELKQEEQMLR